MLKKIALCVLLVTPLSACANGRAFPPQIAKTSEQAKKAVSFCDVAKKSWGEPVAGDPKRTKAQKAAYNGARTYLECKS